MKLEHHTFIHQHICCTADSFHHCSNNTTGSSNGQQVSLNFFITTLCDTERKLFMSNLMNRIEEVLKEKHWSIRKLEREAGISVGSISKWKSGNPSHYNLKKVADVLGVSVAYLTGESNFRSERDAMMHQWVENQRKDLAVEVMRIEAGVRIPVLNEVPCGNPIDCADEFSEWEEISEKLARQGSFYALKVKSDSMSPIIMEGDILIVKQQSTAESGDIVIAKVNGDDACCKKLIRRPDGIVLQSFNPSYEPRFFTNDEINDKHVQIVGKCVENRHKF